MSETNRQIRAKMVAQTVIPAGSSLHNPGTETVELTAVYCNGEANKTWAKYTPSGALNLKIDNPAAQGFFKPGREYWIDIAEVEKEPAATGG